MADTQTNPIDNLLNQALQLTKKLRQNRVMPFHLITALVDNKDASDYLESAGFPIEDLREGVNRLFGEFKRTDIVRDIATSFSKHAGIMTYDARTVLLCKAAQDMAEKNKNGGPGYLELLSCLESNGDMESRTALNTFARVNDKDLIDLIVKSRNGAGAAPARLPSACQAPSAEPVSIDDEFRKHMDGRKKIIHLDQHLKKNVIGQDKAIDAVHEALKRNIAGLNEPDKPLGSFLFPGPTGVGKTELAKQLAEELGVELVRIDMSEYMESHSVARLIGAPPGYKGYDDGGLFAETVGKHKKCVLLLDEMDKAHPDVFNILLQVMDNGELSNKGQKIDFRDTILIMTSNDGAAVKPKATMGFRNSEPEQEDTISSAVKERYAPEFRNRLDAVIPFEPLSKENMVKIAAVIAERLNSLAAAKTYDLSFKVLPETLEAIVDMGYDPEMGARPIKRVIDKQIKNVLANFILTRDLSEAEIVIGFDGNEFTFDSKPHALSQTPKNDNNAQGPQNFLAEGNSPRPQPAAL